VKPNFLLIYHNKSRKKVYVTNRIACHGEEKSKQFVHTAHTMTKSSTCCIIIKILKLLNREFQN